MPNPSNIKRPLILISFGRSGTSLVQAAFRERGDCFACGETGEMVAKIWSGVEFCCENSLINVVHETPSPAQHCAIAIQSVFLSLFASDEPIWFQKHIGVAEEWMDRVRIIGEGEAAAWYWRILTETFPEAKFFTILRNPYDVVISAKAYWQLDEKLSWEFLRIMANFIMHPKSRIDYAISFDALNRSFDEEMSRLCSHLNLVSSPKMRSAKEIRHVPSHLSGSGQQFDYKARWVELTDAPYVDQALSALERVWQRFGYQFERKSGGSSPPTSA